MMKIMVVDDHLLFRDGLVGLFKNRPDYTVVGEAGTVREAVEKANLLMPEIILMDITLPDGTGLDAARAILANHPDCKIVFLTVNDDDEILVEAIQSGAKGYILKNISVASLFANLQALKNGEMAVSRALSFKIIEGLLKIRPPERTKDSRLAVLSQREVEILAEIAGGATNEEIAIRLVLSINTVKHHVHSIFTKLGLENRQEAARFARSVGMGI